MIIKLIRCSAIVGLINVILFFSLEGCGQGYLDSPDDRLNNNKDETNDEPDGVQSPDEPEINDWETDSTKYVTDAKPEPLS